MTKTHKRKKSFLPSIFIAAFVLFLLGFFAVFSFKTDEITKQLKESIEVTAYLEDFVKEAEANQLSAQFLQQTYIKQVKYISKQDALNSLSQDFDLSFLEENPLPASFQIRVSSSYAKTDSLQVLKQQLESTNEIAEVEYSQLIVDVLNTNSKKVGLILIVIAIIFIIIAFTLIDTTIRLIIFSKRFTIKSMQLVGAKSSFIMRPFIQRAIINGVISAVLAILSLILLLQFVSNVMPQVHFDLLSPPMLIILGGMFILGIVITFLATTFAVRKYLAANIEDLY